MTMLILSKQYRFASAHTLRSNRMTDAENQHVYGPCANPSGHGHDYVLEFSIACGSLENDVVIARGFLDRLVDTYVAPRFAYRDINKSFGDEFISSGENLSVAAHALIAPHLPSTCRLSVRVVETEKNSFAYTGE